MGIAGLVLGIISIVICWVPVFGFCLAALGIIFSARGMSHNKHDGCAVGGLVTSIIGVVLGALMTVACLPQIYKRSNTTMDTQNSSSVKQNEGDSAKNYESNVVTPYSNKDEGKLETPSLKPTTTPVITPNIKTASSYNNMKLGDIGVKEDVYIGLSYVKRMTYLPTALGPHNDIGEGNEVILAFFDFYNNANKETYIDASEITCYTDKKQVKNVKSYTKVECDGIKQYYGEDIAEHTQLISVQDFEVPVGWKELKFFYKSDCVWTIKQEDVKTDDFSFKTMYDKLKVSRKQTKEGTAIYNGDYEIIFKGAEDYVHTNSIYGDETYIVFKFTINNTSSRSLDYDTVGYKMSAYQNNYFLGDATYTMDDKIGEYINVYNVESIEPEMSANIYVAFKSFGEPGNLYMIYDEGWLSNKYKGYVYVEQ